jgi:hypothetical protein
MSGLLRARKKTNFVGCTEVPSTSQSSVTRHVMCHASVCGREKTTFHIADRASGLAIAGVDVGPIDPHKELFLKRALLATTLVASFAFAHAAAHAEGCTKGAVVGGVGGHIAGGHGVAGAAAGCAIGHHEAKKKDKAASAAAAASQPAGK